MHVRPHAHPQLLARAHEEGTEGQRVGADRRGEERLDGGPYDGSARGERVRRRAGGGGHDEPVRGQRPDRRASDANVEMHHAGLVRLVDHHVVQAALGPDALAPARGHAGLHHHPVLHLHVPREQALQRRVEIGLGRLGQESQTAEIHAEDRDVRARGLACRGEEGAVAAQNQDGVGARDERSERKAGALAPHRGSDAFVQRHFEPARLEPPRERGKQRPRPFLLPVPDDSDSAGRKRHAFDPTGASGEDADRGSSLSQRSTSRAIEAASSPAWRRSESRVP